MWAIIIVTGILFWTFVFAQKRASAKAGKAVVKRIPVLVLILFLVCCQIVFPASVKSEIAEVVLSFEFALFAMGNLLFWVFFRIQRGVFLYTERFISKFVPVLILFTLFICCGVIHFIDEYFMRKKEALPMMYDLSDLIFYVCLAVLSIAAGGCICNFVYTFVSGKAKRKGS